MKRSVPLAVPRAAAFATGALIALVALTGCAQFGYDQLQIGQELRNPDRLFPAERTTRSDVGLGYLERDWFGRTDAVVVLLTRDRLVAGKFHAAHINGASGWPAQRGYALRGVFDPTLWRLDEAGPLDALRVVADELTQRREGRAVPEAQEWVAAGLVRTVQQWPHLGDAGPAFVRLTELLGRVRAGGTATLGIRPDGTYAVEYTHGTPP